MRFVKLLVSCIALLLVTALIAIGVFAYASLEEVALVGEPGTKNSISRAYPTTESSQPDPTGLISISDHQLGKVIHEFLNGNNIPSNIRIEFAPGKVHAFASLRLPFDFKRKYLNVQVEGRETTPPEHVKIENFKLGAVRIPSKAIDGLRDYALNRCKVDRRCRAGMDTYRNIDSMHLDRGVLNVRYTLGADTFRLLGKTDIDDLQLEPYRQALETIAGINAGKSVELHAALQTVMLVASQRSSENDPVKENAAALMALAMMNADRRVQEILIQPDTTDWSNGELRLKVHQRRDLAQHFVNSAALFLIGGTEFSDYIGIYKEVYDVSSGKEFGTGDLVADRAGVRFAQRATRSQRLALELQQRVLSSNDSAGYLLSKAAIKRFENEHSVNATDQIGAIVTVIDKALRKLPLLH